MRPWWWLDLIRSTGASARLQAFRQHYGLDRPSVWRDRTKAISRTTMAT